MIETAGQVALRYSPTLVLQTVEGTYENGEIRLLGAPPDLDRARVLVTFLRENGALDLGARGIAPKQAENLQARLKTFAEDWNRPEMDAYDSL